jgi:4-amino-4-deoxy-L-arabinose transferase-like glycosyltransferase
VSSSVAVIAGLILLHTGVCLHTALTKNVTHDEIWHLPVGLLHLQSGAFDQDVLNPPLSRMWAALPLWMASVTTERGADGSACGVNFVNSREDFQRWYNRGRVFHLAWTVAAACLVACWAWDLFGPAAAVLATLLYCTCPNVIAHASIVTPDVPLMCLWIATLYAAWRWMKSESWRAALAVGLLLGLAQATKFTAVLLYPILLSAWLVRFLRTPAPSTGEPARHSRRMLLLQPVAGIAVSLTVLCASYGFTGVGTPLRGFNFQSGAMRTIAALLSVADGLPLPAPADWLEGIDAQRFVMEQEHPVFLDGEWNVTGFRRYYVMTLLYKLPHSFQALFVLSAGCLLCGCCGGRRWGVQLFLLLPAALLIGVASLSGMQLGVRYILPVLPLMMLFASQFGIWIAARGLRFRRVAWGVIAAGCLWSLRHHPHHLAYFNEAAGGPIGGREHLLDSNLDWGQDLYLVKSFMEEQGLDEINLVYFGTLWPERLGVHYAVPSGAELGPGWYAVSVNYVMGRPHLVHLPDGESRSTGYQEFVYFRQLDPVRTLGGSIDVYRITGDQPPLAGSD